MRIVKKVNDLLQDRDSKNVMSNVVISFLIKGGGLCISFFTTSSYITYFNNDFVLGVWFTVLSILSWILNFDLGIGNGLRNKLVATIAAKDNARTQKYISSAYLFSFLVSLILLLFGSILSFALPWNSILKISNSILSEKTLALTVLIVLFAIVTQLFLKIIVSISYALQNSYISSLLNLVTSSALLVFVVVANSIGKNGSIISLAIFYFFAVNTPLLIVTIVLFMGKLKAFKPRIKDFDFYYAKDTLKIGIMFLYLQLVAMLINSTANILIANILGSDQVVEFQLYFKVFYIVAAVVSVAIVPFWSAITKAIEEKRMRWLRKVIIILLITVALSALVELFLSLILQFVFHIWLGSNAIVVDSWRAFIFAIYGTVFIWQMVCCYISNGLGKIKIQAVFLTVGVCICFSSSILLAKMWNDYIAITVGMILGYLPYCFVQTIWLIKYCRDIRLQKGNDWV